MSGKPRILAIRGGAIGDFLLTLPALRLLRETFAHCHLEILGYRHIADMAVYGGPVEGSTYADAVRNIEAGPLAGFFARGGELNPEWCEYFGSFQQVVSWLFDPDGIFEANVRRAGVKHFIPAYAKISDENHASVQWAHGLQSLALYLEEQAARLVPTAEMLRLGDEWLRGHGVTADAPFTAIHPGSGSAKKNWPVERWLELAQRVAGDGDRLIFFVGEADQAILAVLERAFAGMNVIFARDLPLPMVAAVMTRARRYFGHDTGVSHLAAAVGIPATVLFGPTDPSVWAPRGSNAQVVVAPRGDLRDLRVQDVLC
jgi:heptosyltransferase III